MPARSAPPSGSDTGCTIRAFAPADWEAVWPVLRNEFRSGESHPHDPAIGIDEAHRAWIEAPQATFVAEDRGGVIVGTYLIKPNQPGLGAHVCNCGYIVAPEARGRGIGRAMCAHSLAEARRLGYRAMQYNLVVATNTGAKALWDRMGFSTVGRLPGAFRHPRHGFVDAFVMFRDLTE
ncbi:N-acetyltransferase family protein [Algiphilus sp.]|uniref:GNAT family N-acetyltransferase n=1 Tax=Algiphilus sp. TaxID=1872431 RepID=UPI003C4F8490